MLHMIKKLTVARFVKLLPTSHTKVNLHYIYHKIMQFGIKLETDEFKLHPIHCEMHTSWFLRTE
jgi:hypothetical protein